MSEATQNTNVIIDEVEYDTSNFSQEQLVLLQHCIDLQNKINSSLFVTQQLQVGKDSFVQMLKKSLEAKPETEVVQ